MTDVLQQTATIVDALQKVRDEALRYGRRVTDTGKGIDAHQVHAERLAYLATEVEAARALLTYAQAAHGHGETQTPEMALSFASTSQRRTASSARSLFPSASGCPPASCKRRQADAISVSPSRRRAERPITVTPSSAGASGTS